MSETNFPKSETNEVIALKKKRSSKKKILPVFNIGDKVRTCTSQNGQFLIGIVISTNKNKNRIRVKLPKLGNEWYRKENITVI